MPDAAGDGALQTFGDLLADGIFGLLVLDELYFHELVALQGLVELAKERFTDAVFAQVGDGLQSMGEPTQMAFLLAGELGCDGVRHRVAPWCLR